MKHADPLDHVERERVRETKRESKRGTKRQRESEGDLSKTLCVLVGNKYVTH